MEDARKSENESCSVASLQHGATDVNALIEYVLQLPVPRATFAGLMRDRVLLPCDNC